MLPQMSDGSPVTDALSLEKWMEEKLDDIPIQLQRLNPQDYLHRSEQVYTAVFRELCRQVAIADADRGRLLVSLWNLKAEIFQKAAEITLTSLQHTLQQYKGDVADYVKKRLILF